MVPGVGGGELILIAVVALVVVGPKDLPKLLRQTGKFVGKMRRMADEFKTSFDDMARQSELDDLRKEVEALRSGQSMPLISDVNQQMTAISHDIDASLRTPPAPIVEAPQITEPLPPQMEGLPPRGPETAAPQPEPEVVVKKARTRKPVSVTADALVEEAPQESPKPKRTRRKTAP